MPRRWTRRQFLIGSAATAAVAAAAATGVAVGSVRTVDVSRHPVPVRGLRAPLRLALLTDLHYGPFIRPTAVERWVDLTLAERPDLIVLGGDLVDHDAPDELRPLLEAVARLRAPQGVWAVWGNHDHSHFGDLTPFGRALEGVGVRLLVNRGVPVRDDLFLAGVDDLRRGAPDLTAALARRPADRACVLLSHNPDVLPEVPTSVDLTLCGHTHGGQVRLPGIGPLVTSSRYGRRFASGWVEGPARGYVSRGLGVSWLPLRVDCPAELAVFELRPD